MSGNDLRRAWDAEAENWVRWARTPGHDVYFWEWGLPVLLELLPAPGRLALDVGSGEGRLGRILRERGYRVAGIDASVVLARAAAGHPDSAPTAVGDAARLPFADGVADLAVFYMTLQDIDDAAGAVREAGRCLAPGGRLVACFVHPINGAMDLETFRRDGVASIRDYFTPEPSVFVADRDGITMTFHSISRPLEQYTRALEDAGFFLESIREPQPTASFLRWREKDERWTRIPWAMFLRAVKSPIP